jgi:acetyl-CoA synthetase
VPTLLDLDTYDAVRAGFAWERLWELVDGTPERLNLAHECVDRHRGPSTAVSVSHPDGRLDHIRFDELADLTGRVAHWLAARGVEPGDRVAIVLEPGRAFYAALFGAVKRGAIAVPLFTLFGPEGLALRVEDCRPRLLLAEGRAEDLRRQFPGVDVVSVDDGFWRELAGCPAEFTWQTRAADLAVFQYTSGTTREMPAAVRHSHRAVVTLMIAALYGVGLRPGDRYFCPSSPAWGHGLWHGTIAPLALGVTTGSYAGRFDAARLFGALEALEANTFAAAPTVFRLLRQSGLRERHALRLEKISFTGEPMDAETARWVESAFGAPACSMYGSTEVGVILVSFPGLSGYRVRPGALGSAAPGWEVSVIDEAGRELPPGELGEIAVRRKGEWFRVKDRGQRDAEGYVFHAGRSDDVIISAGWTMSALEIEQSLLAHPAVAEVAVVGVPDALRGQVVKAFIVPRGAAVALSGDVARDGGGERAETVRDIQEFMKARLSQHEYPRQIEFVVELPRTPAGKINRKALRDRAGAAPAAADPTSSAA